MDSIPGHGRLLSEVGLLAISVTSSQSPLLQILPCCCEQKSLPLVPKEEANWRTNCVIPIIDMAGLEVC